MRGLVVTSCLAIPFVLAGCGVEPSSAAGASLQVAPKAEPVKPITPIAPILREQTTNTIQLDREAGDIRFGDGEHGKRLPSTEASTATYRAGQGAAGGHTQRAVTAKDSAELARPEPGVAVHRVQVTETPRTDDDSDP